MRMFMRLLSALPRNLLLPAIVLAAGWYGGAKYGAPDYLVNSIDGVLDQGAELVGGFIGGDDNDQGAS